ncbi:MAG: cupin domain-containing protein [Candidatus Binataceae bacterium]|nr:cupin domain-containing protein [Candidatus Binataceae bacterium]
MTSPANVVHLDAIGWVDSAQGRFRSRRKALGAAAGSRMLGASVYEIPPGAAAWPYHFHCANEEAIYVLEGAGTLRLGDAEIALRAGHFVALPAGRANAHRLDNTSAAPLRYLCVSTMIEPEVSFYPDSDKFGVMAGAPPGGDKARRTFSGVFRIGPAVGYFDGEPDA